MDANHLKQQLLKELKLLLHQHQKHRAAVNDDIMTTFMTPQRQVQTTKRKKLRYSRRN